MLIISRDVIYNDSVYTRIDSFVFFSKKSIKTLQPISLLSSKADGWHRAPLFNPMSISSSSS